MPLSLDHYACNKQKSPACYGSGEVANAHLFASGRTCKRCRAVLQAEWRQKNKERIETYRRRLRVQRRQKKGEHCDQNTPERGIDATNYALDRLVCTVNSIVLQLDSALLQVDQHTRAQKQKIGEAAQVTTGNATPQPVGSR